MDYQLLLFFVFVAAVLAVGRLFPMKCPTCKVKLKLERISDNFGINITKKLILTPFSNPRFDSYFVCPKCGSEYVQKSNRTNVEKCGAEKTKNDHHSDLLTCADCGKSSYAEDSHSMICRSCQGTLKP